MEEPGLPEPLEFVHWFLQAAGRGAHIQLHHLLACDVTRIGDGDGSGEAFGAGFHGRLRIGKGGVTEAEPKGIGDLCARRLEIAVAHPDILRVAGEIHVFLRMTGRERIVVEREIGRRGDVQETAREGHGQLAGWIHLPRQDVGNGVGTFLAGRPGQHDGVHQMLPGSRFHDPAHIEDYHHPLPSGTKGLVQVNQQFPLRGGEFEVVLHMPVLPFPGLASENHNSHIVQRSLEPDGRGGENRFLPILVVLHGLDRKAVLQSLRLQGVILLETLVQGESGVLQGLGHGDHIRFGHIAGTGSTGNEILAGNAIQSHSFTTCEGQCMTFVAQQDDGLGRRFPRRKGMGLQVGMAGIGILPEMRRLHHIFQDPPDVAVHFLHGQTAVPDSLQNAFDLHIGPRIHQVVAGLDRQDGIVLEPPVRNHNAVIAPLIPKDRGKQLVILLGVFAIQFVVGTHDRPGLSFLHRNFKILQVDFPEGPAAHQRVILGPVGLLVVHGVVLDGGSGPIGLDAPDIGRRHLPTQERVFGEILEVPSIERITMNVHARCEQHVHAIFQDLIAQNGRRPLHQVRIPRTGQEGPHRKSRRHRMGGIPVRINPDTGRAVGENGLRNPQARNGPRTARQARHQVVGAGTHQQRGLLLQGHRLQDLVDVILPQLRLRHRRHHGQHPSNRKTELPHIH